MGDLWDNRREDGDWGVHLEQPFPLHNSSDRPSVSPPLSAEEYNPLLQLPSHKLLIKQSGMTMAKGPQTTAFGR